jgi:hypothetical protein
MGIETMPRVQKENTMKLNVRRLAIFAGCLVGASVSNAQPAPGQSHIETLAAQANQTAAALGEKVDQVSAGAANFFAIGKMSTQLLTTLGNLSAANAPVNNPNESEDFISRLAGNTESEESVAWCGTNALVGFNDSGSFVKTMTTPVSPSFSFSFNGWSRSTDAGASFVDKGILIADPLGFPLSGDVLFRDLFGDPVLGCSSSTVFYYASLATDTRRPPLVPLSGISVSKSIDGGNTFQGAIMASSKSVFNHELDKPWMAVDGNILHVTYTDFFFGDPRCPPPGIGASIEHVRSVDGGATWSAPIVLDTACGFTPFVQGSQVAVGPAGSNAVYVAWESFPNGLGTGRTIRLKKSVNGGETFPAVFTTISAVTAVGDGSRVQGLFRTFIDLQGLAVDLTSNQPTSGNVYTTWHDGRRLSQTDRFAFPGCKGTGTYCFGDVLLSRSTNGGSTWSSPFQVNNDPLSLADHLFPGLAVDNNGGVRVVFYDRRRDTRNFLIDTFVGTSLDAGATWTNTRVTPNSFPSIHAQDLVVNPAYMGDYLGIAVDRLKQLAGVIAAWGDNSLGDPNVVSAKQVP